MKLKGIIDYDMVNYKEPTLTLLFNHCDFKCDKLNGCKICQNSTLAQEPDIDVSGAQIWKLYTDNPLTKAFCLQGLEPFDSFMDLIDFISFIRIYKRCDDPIIIYTGYNKGEDWIAENAVRKYNNIIVKWGRYIMGQEPHLDPILGVKLASDNQYAELIK